MPEGLLIVAWAACVLLAALVLLLLWHLLRPASDATTAQLERLERELRDELARLGQASRADLAALQRSLLAQGGEQGRTQTEHLRRLSEATERRLNELRQAVEGRLVALQDGNERKLEQMRATVDEKLHATLEQRLGESFRQVAERLEQVHQGLGEMQGLARDVGSLNRVLNNVKTRGVVGEVQLAALLQQVFTAAQYAQNVATVPGSNERVEFAIRLPGPGSAAPGGSAAPLWLPIDAKFPREDYERLLDAHERADAAALEQSARALEARLRLEARSIRGKYLAPPHTTDFAILFLPTEGLYAEALRRPGLAETLQRDDKVMLAGPTTLLALLNSLQMGFRTLALERRSAEVWDVLGAVKTEFGRFGEVLAKTRKKLQEASHSIDAAEVRTRAMVRQLKDVEALPLEPGRVTALGSGLEPASEPPLPSALEGLDGDAADGDTAARRLSSGASGAPIGGSGGGSAGEPSDA